MWSRWARDWNLKRVEEVVRRLGKVRGGDIILLHDGDHRRLHGNRNLTLAGLDYWIPMWRSAGLEFVTLDGIAGRSVPLDVVQLAAELPSAPLSKSHACGK